MLTQARLKELLEYNPETGEFRWRVSTSNRVAVGNIAGSYNDKGYVSIKLGSDRQRAHRLAFLYMTGKWPKYEVDHINGIRDDNRWGNLRESTSSQNHSNSCKYKNNTSGYKGVIWSKFARKYMARVQCNNRTIHIGYFEKAEDAARAYDKKARELFGEFAKLNFPD